VFEDFTDGAVGKADLPVPAKFLSQMSESIIGLFRDLDNKIFNLSRGFAGTVMGTAGAILREILHISNITREPYYFQ